MTGLAGESESLDEGVTKALYEQHKVGFRQWLLDTGGMCPSCESLYPPPVFSQRGVTCPDRWHTPSPKDGGA